jgi:spore maturation protein CgeB
MSGSSGAGDGLDIAFFGSSIVSSWWNGACTYYRGIIRGLHQRGHRVTFYEPHAFDRQQHRDIGDPEYARVVVYPAERADDVRETVARAASADVIVKTSGIGVFDDLIEDEVSSTGGPAALRIFWDVDAPATLARLESDPCDPFHEVLPRFDVVLTYGGGDPVLRRYEALGARETHVVYNALDPVTHFPAPASERLAGDCGLLANRLPDREERIEEFFLRAAAMLPERQFVLGGNGWGDKAMPPNVRWVGHVGTQDHNSFNCSSTTVLNVTRDSMAANGWSPATRVFEAAGAAACLITDEWSGIDHFFEPGSEVLVARDGAEVAGLVDATDPAEACRIGEAAARRALRDHTYETRASTVDELLQAKRPERANPPPGARP